MGSFRWFGHDQCYPVVCRAPVLRPAVQCFQSPPQPRLRPEKRWQRNPDRGLKSGGKSLASSVATEAIGTPQKAVATEAIGTAPGTPAVATPVNSSAPWTQEQRRKPRPHPSPNRAFSIGRGREPPRARPAHSPKVPKWVGRRTRDPASSTCQDDTFRHLPPFFLTL